MGRANHYHNEFHIKHPFAIVFRYFGTVWPLVIPYCLFNIALLTALTILQSYAKINISILPTGHALMSILIAYLGVSKVSLAYERFITAQEATAHALVTLRELNQLSITLTEPYDGKEVDEWRYDTKHAIIQLIHETVATLRDERHAAALARNVGHRSGVGIVGAANSPRNRSRTGARVNTEGSDDPMVLVHALRSHLFHGSDDVCRVVDERGNVTKELQLFERTKLIDLLHEFTVSYRNLLRLASSPLPFVLVQMGRTFIFIWTLSLPFVLMGDKFEEEYLSSFSFVILLTYGFLGLEFVSRMLANPFGDEIENDFNIRGMGSAAIVGIEEDSDQKRTRGLEASSLSLRHLVSQRQRSVRMSTKYIVLDASKDAMETDEPPSYYGMDDGSEQTPTVFL